ncbi:NAD(P)-binding protein [Coniophora puteana RWD-64-598 SS2]|uniref:NAD(P)-binding protein n=1 Tax=Coniophora puteana (strain RWD-64-598) TaxID=741705 RepID=A0A5M3M9I9_CONPW|nr:NAD(P)-binding protein [Coniophora puteana RWD-64-598 SS2]EIW75747.1 NAD(P)-binding protein [Coniophora puteana RWD-64-598 SS2]
MTSPYDVNTSAEVIVKDLAAYIEGKVVLVTGVSPGGLGAVFVEHIAKAKPRLLILAGRNAAKGQATADAVTTIDAGVQTRILQLDLESLAGARSAAAEVNGWQDVPHIDVLVNNAGIMACDYAKTKDGFERQFATNHLGPFLFTNLIMNKLLKAQSPRVVMVSSDGHRLSFMRWPDVGFSDGQCYNKWRAYGQSKTANMLMAVELAQRLGKRGLTAVSLHPGAIGTNIGNHIQWDENLDGLITLDKELGNREGLWSGFPFKDPGHGVATHVYASFEPSLRDHNGCYLQDSHIADPYVDTVKPYALDKVEADRLWKLSEELVGEKFAY